MRVKKLEPYVLKALEENNRARQDDFVLYRIVLEEMEINTYIWLWDFLTLAKALNVPSFESVSRCRRHIQELRPDLKDSETAIKREEKQDEYVAYNLTGIGE